MDHSSLLSGTRRHGAVQLHPTGEINPQWGNAFRELYTFAAKRTTTDYQTFLQSIAVAIDKRNEFNAGDLGKFIDIYQDLSVELKDSNRSIQRKDVVTIRGRLIRMERLVHFIGLWAAVEGFTSYFDESWWEPYGIPLHLIFHTVKLLIRLFPTQFRHIIHHETYDAGESVIRCIEHISANNRLMETLPSNLGSVLPEYAADSDYMSFTFQEVVRMLSEVHRLRSFRCLHPMQRASMHPSPSLYEKRLQSQGRPTTRTIVGGGEAFIFMPSVDSADKDDPKVLHLLGSALFHTAAGLPSLDMHHNPSDIQMTALHTAMHTIQGTDNDGAPDIIENVTPSWKNNFRSLLRWAQQTKNRGDGYRMSAQEIREITALLFRENDRPVRDSYMIISRACFDRIAATGMAGTTPPCRLLAALFMGISPNHDIPTGMPGSNILKNMKKMFASTFPFEYLKHIDEEISHHAMGPNGHQAPVAQALSKPQSLLEMAWDSMREAQPHSVVNRIETSWSAYFWSSPALASLLYTKPHNLVDVQHAVAHMDYMMLALCGATIFRSDGKLSDLAGAMWPSTIVRGVDNHAQTTVFNSSQRQLMSKMSAAYVGGLIMQICQRSVSSPSSSLEAWIIECMAHEWSAFDLIRLAAYHGSVPHILSDKVTATGSVQKSAPMLPMGLNMETLRITALAVLKVTIATLIERATGELGSDRPNLMAFFMIYGIGSTLMAAENFSEMKKNAPWLTINLNDIAMILETANQSSDIRSLWNNQAVVVDDRRFAAQSHVLKFCHDVYPATTTSTSSSATSGDDAFIPSDIQNFQRVYISSHAKKMFDLMIYATRIHSIYMRPDYLATYMDSTVIPISKAYGRGFGQGLEDFYLPQDLVHSVSRLASNEWSKTKSSTKFDSSRGAVLFQPSPAFHSPVRINDYYGPIEMDVSPRIHTAHVRQVAGMNHAQTQNAQYKVNDWTDHGAELMGAHFWHSQTSVRTVGSGGVFVSGSNNFHDRTYQSASGVHAISDEDLYSSEHLRTFVDIKYEAPEKFDTDLDYQIAETRVSTVPHMYDFYQIPSTHRGFLHILMKKAITKWRGMTSRGLHMSYRTFNAFLRETFSHRTYGDRMVWNDPAVPIDYNIKTDRVIPKSFYHSKALIIAVPDCVMSVIERFIVTSDQRAFFIYCHCFSGIWDEPIENMYNPHYADTFAPKLFLQDLFGNVVCADQLLDLGVVESTPLNQYLLSHCRGIIETRAFVPTAFSHFSKLALTTNSFGPVNY